MSLAGWLLGQALRPIGAPLPVTRCAHVPSVVTVTEAKVQALLERHPEPLDPGRVKGATRQHRLLNLPRDLEIVLQREPIRHFDDLVGVAQRNAEALLAKK